MAITHSFKCLDCSVKFSIESEESDIHKATADIPARCPQCLKVWGEKGSRIEIQLMIDNTTGDTLEARRKRNAEASREAKIQAAEYQRTMAKEEFVQVKDPAGKKPPEIVPKAVVETLTQTIKDYNS